MKAVVFHADAETELIEAAAYYEAQQRDLGKRFLTSVQDAINRIILNPRLYPVSNSMCAAVSREHFPSVFCSETVPTTPNSHRVNSHRVTSHSTSHRVRLLS